MHPPLGADHRTTFVPDLGQRLLKRPMRLTTAFPAVLLGGAVGALGLLLTLSPLGAGLEEEAGLDWLFQVRGPRPAPTDVVIVALDRVSAGELNLPNRPDQWPRSLHARLLDSLGRQGAAVVAFDLVFDKPRDAVHDAALAAALARAGNVVLFQYLQKEPGPAGAHAAVIERLVPPLPALAQSAAALAPFPLPKVPVKVSQYWTFRAGALEHPTLPVVAFQIRALSVYEPWRMLLQEAVPALALPADPRALLRDARLVDAMRAWRTALRSEPHATAVRSALAARADRLGPAQQRLLASLVRLYTEPSDSRYLDFYGPPRSVTTLPYHEALTGGLPAGMNLAGKLVFVGFAERWQPEQQDGFYTAFSSADSGLDISGVEIGATAAANLLEDRPVRPLPWRGQLALVFGWGVVVGVLGLAGRALLASGIVLLLAAGYLLFAHQQFADDGRWLPLVVPLLLQMPAALLGAAWWRYHETNRERAIIRTAFGYHLPNKVVDELARNMGDFEASRELLYGVCLASDVAQYTTLAERLDPRALATLMNRYFAAIFPPVRAHGGIVSDVVGDAMVAIWAAARPEAELRTRSGRAALAVSQAADAFARTPGNDPLPTRIGLHAGQMLLGHVGGADHYEYRAVGDIVNTANRIEALNKVLDTRILASAEALEGVTELQSRELGAFRLAGKSAPIVVHELLGVAGDSDARRDALCTGFEQALAAFRAGHWDEAHVNFLRLSAQFPDDGPTRFYRELSARYRRQPPPADWQGVIQIDTK